ncbi:circadian clock-controlled protein-like [Anoplophora glabripennis]|uniref:circadian clock-controlled protein-like n=1 Tax=Anoplophora glabripennis TaxID=217634 RepID=UPI0008753413|nr:circadian clock-controlled protein-like [Anoplophora glabripennis]
MYSKSLTIVFVYISIVYSKRLSFPSYIKRCSPSVSDFDDCCLRNGKEAILHLEKGDRNYDIPNMLPMIVPSISVETGPDFSLLLTNLLIYGLETADLKQLKFDLKKKKISGQLFLEGIEIEGKYDVNGKILVIPIQGSGVINVTTVGCAVDYFVDYELVEKEGEEYLNITNGASNISFKRVYFNLTNLFNGNEELGASTNKVLNDEWEKLVDTLTPVVGKTVADIVNSIINGVARHVPFKEFFLD